METLRTVALGALGIASCLALLLVAGQLGIRWHRVVVSMAALQGLVYQGALWGGVTFTLKRFDVGGSYFWLYAALLTCVTGTVWALYLLSADLFSRRFTD
jgi:hypothetical protein